MASVHVDNSFICSGTVISARWVMTAAHCIQDGAYAVRVGSPSRSSGGKRIRVDQAIPHPWFDPWQLTNDVGLLHLASDAPVSPVRLADTADDLLERDGASATVVGWGDITPTLGLMSPDAMRQGQVNIVSDERCFGDSTSPRARTSVCDTAFVEGACNGDSGGALLGRRSGRYVQIGVISNGTPVLCGYASWLSASASAEVNATSIRSFIRARTGL